MTTARPAYENKWKGLQIVGKMFIIIEMEQQKQTGDYLYRACIFDLDGTLADTLDSIAYFANAALRERGYGEIETDAYRGLVGNGADVLMRGMLRTVLGGERYSEEEVAALRKAYDRLYESTPMYLVKNYPGMPETLKKLKAQGVRTAVLSNKPHNCTCAIIETLFSKGTFDLYYGQRPEVPRKPSPQGALLIARELGTAPEEMLYIGDTNVDMKTGRGAGMRTAGVLWGFRGRDELEKESPDYLVKKPEELYGIVVGDGR